jgi:hypothetical protein
MLDFAVVYSLKCRTLPDIDDETALHAAVAALAWWAVLLKKGRCGTDTRLHHPEPAANSEAGGACQNCQFPSRVPIPTLVLFENTLASGGRY